MALIHKKVKLGTGSALAPNHIPDRYQDFESWGHFFQVSKDGLVKAYEDGARLRDVHGYYSSDHEIGLFAGCCFLMRNNKIYDHTHVLENCRSLLHRAVHHEQDRFINSVNNMMNMSDRDAEAFYKELNAYLGHWNSGDYDYVAAHYRDQLEGMFDIMIHHTATVDWDER